MINKFILIICNTVASINSMHYCTIIMIVILKTRNFNLHFWKKFLLYFCTGKLRNRYFCTLFFYFQISEWDPISHDRGAANQDRRHSLYFSSFWSLSVQGHSNTWYWPIKNCLAKTSFHSTGPAKPNENAEYLRNYRPWSPDPNSIGKVCEGRVHQVPDQSLPTCPEREPASKWIDGKKNQNNILCQNVFVWTWCYVF